MQKRESCDVLVVGTGLTGALTAWALAEAGLDVVAVDRRSLCGGSTRASTAILQYDLDRTLTELGGRYGMDRAASVYRCTRAALDELAELIDRLAIDCDLARRPGLLLATADHDLPALQREVRARHSAGLDAEFLDQQQLRERFGIARPGAVASPVALEFDPVRLCRGLWAHCLLRGVRVYPETTIINQRWGGSQPVVYTASGHTIDTTHVVFATGYEAPEMFPALRRLVSLKTTFVAATPPLPPERLPAQRPVMSEKARPYRYVRTTADHRVLIGGGDVDGVDRDRQEQLLKSKTEQLLDALAALFPSMGRVPADRAWAGAFVQTADGLPYIGSLDLADRCHFALGYGGNGMVLGVVAANIVRDEILAINNPAAPLFAFGRQPACERPSSAGPLGRLAG